MLGQQQQLSVYCSYVIVHVRSVNVRKGELSLTLMEHFATPRSYQLVDLKSSNEIKKGGFKIVVTNIQVQVCFHLQTLQGCR